MSNILCRLCDKEYNIKQLGLHLKAKHSITYSDYAQKYWEDLPNWGYCKYDMCNNICKNAYCSTECFKKGQYQMLKKRVLPPRSIEHAKKISIAAKERFTNPKNHPMYGKKHSKESIEKMSVTQKQFLANLEVHPMQGRTHSEATKQIISAKSQEYYKNNSSPFKGKRHTPETLSKIFAKKQMNKLEELVANYLYCNNIKYKFQFFINNNGVCKSYDFKLKGLPILLEIHGDYWHGGIGVDRHAVNVNETISNDQLKQTIATQMGYTLIVIWEHEIKNNIDVIKERIDAATNLLQNI